MGKVQPVITEELNLKSKINQSEMQFLYVLLYQNIDVRIKKFSFKPILLGRFESPKFLIWEEIEYQAYNSGEVWVQIST